MLIKQEKGDIKIFFRYVGHVDELAAEPFLLLHREHGTDYRRS